MISTNSRRGFSLLDALIGIAVVAIGLLAAVGLQTSSLQSNAKAEQLTGAYEAAHGEMSWWLKRTLPTTGVSTGVTTCQTTTPSGAGACQVTIESCSVVSGAFTCSTGAVSNIAYRVTVDYTGPRGDAVSLTSVATGKYIDGSVE